MHNLGRKSFFILLLLMFFGYHLYPPQKQLRLGKDLRGGTTLIYQLRIEPGMDATSVVQRTIEVLKDRVDPNGLLEITIVPQGRDRLEITMPMPSPEMQALRRAFEDELRNLASGTITRDRLHRALEMAPAERAAQIREMARGNPQRLARLEEAAAAFDAYRSAMDGYAQDPTNPEVTSVAAQAQIASDAAIAAVERVSLSADELRQALELSSQGRVLRDRATGKTVEIPSPREAAITRLRDRYPALAEDIDRVVEAHDAYLAKRTTLDDPSDLIRLLKNSGALSFRITVDSRGDRALDAARVQQLRDRLREDGPRRGGDAETRWFKINKLETWYDDVQKGLALQADPAGYFEGVGPNGYVVEEFQNEYWMLCWDTRLARLTQGDEAGKWGVAAARQTADDIGRPAIGFTMDAAGSVLLGNLTGEHVGQNMAVLLDDQVYTAPRLNSRIAKQGIIEGEFSQAELDYIIKVLSAGSLQAGLFGPISQNTIGPELGADNLRSGLWAGLFGFAAVSAFMIAYYFRCGVVAFIALCTTALMILGALALNRAALTLPGIAGIVLTFGMAVDANVLIFERVREEVRKGNDLKTAVRLGFQKALSSIVDGNVTNLIVCIVLVLPGVSTQEVKGFAITLGVGVVATMFSALVISRMLMTVMVNYTGWKRLGMLPLAVPVIDRVLEPKVNWIGMRWLFVAISSVYVGLGLFMVFSQGTKMLDTEFLGGTKVVLQFRALEGGGHLEKELEDVRRRVQTTLVERALADSDPDNDVLAGLRTSEIIPLDPQSGGTVSDKFQIKTTIEDDEMVLEALVEEFRDDLDVKPALRFIGSEGDTAPVVFPVTSADLRSSLGGHPGALRFASRDVTDYVDGAVVLLEGLDPPPTLDDLRTKLEQFRQSAAPGTLARARDIVVLEGTESAVQSAAVVVRDELALYTQDPGAWDTEVARAEWDLAREGLTSITTVAQVDQFSSAIAQTFKARAIAAVALSFMAILIYIWVRFGSMRYSLAAIACLVHDCLTTIGLIALAEILYDHAPFVRSIGIMPFKIDLNMIAALLTIIGYSLNDTIIVMDRIRENKGKMRHATAPIINLSINQTISRTVITSGTTLLAAMVLYVFGGEGVRAFSFALVVGVGVGTYSSIAIAAPIIWSSGKHQGPAVGRGGEALARRE